jgi:DNA-binding CsgD family transcriptional regulator
VRFAWPLTGRSEELRTIDAAITASDVSGMLICGAAGVGKSRIAHEALESAASRGCETRWALATSSAQSLPLGAFASWAGSEGTDNLQLVRSVIESLTASSSGAPVVLGVDDVHLLDELSTFVLQQIVQRGAAKLVLTVRDGEPISSATRDIWKAGQFERLDLQPLSQDESTTLLSTALEGSVDPDAATRLWKLTRGNVLYLRNIVEQEETDGRLAQVHAYWRWSGEPKVSPGLVELIESRIGALPTPVDDVIDALAVGEPIDLASLTRIANSAAIENADDRGLITLESVDGHVEVRVAHPLYGEVRRKGAAPTRLRRLRGLVATELAASDGCDDMRIVVRRAALSLDSDLAPDPDLFLRAAQGAVWLSDLPLADRLGAAAIRAGAGAEANLVRAHALSWMSRGEESDSVLADTPMSEFAEADHARLAFLRATNMLWSLADPSGAKQLVDDVQYSHGCIDAFLAVYWAAMGKPEAAANASRDLDLEQLPHLVAAVAAWGIVVESGDAGRTGQAVTAAEAGYAAANRAFDAAQTRFVIADAHISALWLSGQVTDAQGAAERLRQQSADLPGPAQLFNSALAGRAALGTGGLQTACSLLEPVVDALSASGEANGFGYRYQLARTIALAVRGSTAEAAVALAALQKQRHRSWRFLDYEWALAEAWVTASQGAVSAAVATMLSAAETARTNGQFAAEVLCLQAATQFGEGCAAGRLAELAAIVEGPRVGLAARFAAALRDHDGAELEAVSEEFERMGDLVAALDAAAHAAVAYRNVGRRGSAYGCTARAETLAQRSGASTPALVEAAEELPLTSREREIVKLIGAGFSSRVVAQRLGLSVRTIEGHIYRAMGKTGTTTRDELAALLPRHGST